MAKTIMITGASTGIGRATALYFKDKGWNVAATMRTPERVEGLSEGPKLKLYRLDVLDEASIDQAMAAAIGDFGKIDVILNNAGYGAMGPIEAATKSQVERQFDTNVTGLISVMQRFITLFREQGGGTIINVSSIGGRITLPFYSLYHGTKWAVEGITESLSFELEQFGIKMKLIEPGAIATDFGDRSQDVLSRDGLTAYDDYMAQFNKVRDDAVNSSAPAEAVAKVIYKAATDNSGRLRYLVGKDAKLFWRIRRIFGDTATIKAIRKRMKG
jgi:NAD(P)-dependent dehydrogenase (short-subunit alcohol dehydrogenase family)